MIRNARRFVARITVLAGLALVTVAPTAGAVSDYTWTGAASSSGWSQGGNWGGSGGPIPGESVGTLTFPAPLSGCTACYQSDDDVGGIVANAIHIADDQSYSLLGDQLGLGAGGITAAPGSAGSSPQGGTNIANPLVLSTSQTWSVTGVTTPGVFGGLEIGGGVSGSQYTLGVQLGNQGELDATGNGIEVGAFTATGADTADTGLNAGRNGTIRVASLNSLDGNPISLTDVQLDDDPNQAPIPHTLQIGPLTATGANVAIGDGNTPDALMSVNGPVTFGAGNVAIFAIDQAGSTPGTDYSQLSATGNITLGGDLQVDQGGACATLGTGATATLITTSGALSGVFANAPDGAVIPLVDCPSQGLAARIGYTANSVTATVVSGGTTSTSLSADSGAATTNQPVSLTATVRTGTPLYAGPAGTVAFLDGTTAVPGCTAQPLTASDASTGTATCSASFAASGSPTALTAVFTPAGGLGLTGSTSPPLSLTVSPAATTTSVSASTATVLAGQSVTYTAGVTPAMAGATGPTGTVGFLDAGTPVAGCASQPLSSAGVATCTTTPAVGGHPVTAAYAGDANFTGSSSPATTVTATNSPPPTSPLPTGTPIGAPSSAGTPRVGAAKLHGPSASVPVSCTGAGTCTVTLTLTVTETRKGGKLVAVTARRTRTTHQRITLARARATITAGHTKTVTLRLSAAGRQLLGKRRTLAVTLAIDQVTAGRTRPIRSRTLTFKTHS